MDEKLVEELPRVAEPEGHGTLVVSSAETASLVVMALRGHALFEPLQVFDDGGQALGFVAGTDGFTIPRAPRLIIWELANRRDWAQLSTLKRHASTVQTPTILLAQREAMPQASEELGANIVNLPATADESFHKALVSAARGFFSP